MMSSRMLCIGFSVATMLISMLRHAQWHAGFFTMEQTPHGRGFNTSLGFMYGVDHWVRNIAQHRLAVLL